MWSRSEKTQTNNSTNTDREPSPTLTVRVEVFTSVVQEMMRGQLTTITLTLTLTYSKSAAIFRTSPVANFPHSAWHFLLEKEPHGRGMAESGYSSL